LGAFLQIDRFWYLDKNLLWKQVGIASCFINFSIWHSKIGGRIIELSNDIAIAHGNALLRQILASTVLGFYHRLIALEPFGVINLRPVLFLWNYLD